MITTPLFNNHNETFISPLTGGFLSQMVSDEGELAHYHDRWCPGSLRRQVISVHDIDYPG